MPSTTPSDAFESRSQTPSSSETAFPASPGPQSPPAPVTAQETSSHSRQPSYTQSPLSPRMSQIARIRPDSRLVFDESHNPGIQRGSMLLYRLASDGEAAAAPDVQPLPPPPRPFSHSSFCSDVSRQSTHSPPSNTSESKYPANSEKGPAGAFLPYVYDPTSDQSSPPDADDILHDPSVRDSRISCFNFRGMANFIVIFLLISALLCLFTVYPILSFLHNDSRNLLIDNNVQVNGTGQVALLQHMPQVIDKFTPDNVKTRTGYDGKKYELVFSDEFNVDGRSFYPGDDPFWEAVDLWYGATEDMEWYDPAQVTTKGGYLRIRIDKVDPTHNHNLNYVSGMLQSWNKFCFTGGYVEASVSFPGASSDVSGYWPGLWIMGNLARPGYPASTDGMWPYSYSSCDLGTFPNQTNKDKQGPPAALHTNYGRDKYNFELSWLPGQRASACTCPADASEHPGPSPNIGRGAPEIDVFEAQKNKVGPGGKVSQSAQFAPFNHDYVSLNGTGQARFYNPDITAQNSYQGSALQQAASALTTVPEETYAGTGGKFTSFGFEYWGDPKDNSAGYITWQVGGNPSYGITSAAVGPDSLSQVDQRLISVEPMSLVINLGMSQSFQSVDLTKMTFPAEFLIDYVRVYQRTEHKNVGCDPEGFPTREYIANHLTAYTNANLTSWAAAGYTKPKNSLWDGC